MMPDAIMLFAAGFGTRMRHLTQDRPKPLVPVAGKPLLQHALDQVAGYGPLRCVANAHYHADQVQDYLRGTDVAVSVETGEILDTGGGLRRALPLLASHTVFTMNTDAVWKGANGLAQLSKAWNPSRMDALMLCVPKAQTFGHDGDGNITLGADGRLRWGQGMVYSGLQIIKADALDLVPAPIFSLRRVWDALEARGRLFGVAYSGQWCDVGSPEGVELAEKMLSSDV
ncbi:nucleotidyltransferase family protein [Pseudoprimorskyibacter insulae]|uniref:UTP--glucose-1-phosphate uridylyltransferase n=1 Tax=Pseudoprimorskyibacter insulae TaxID=1695997 RepID=A0A2R8AU11_9RHOB|nr:nucleotidyltransferase family protein [Pseudoprimorskyibacter insulae]SPF79533.1 UTP--glucose-1-phosphate uridylyltransferase [Pseudoprimorskyibacter insulae]